VKSRSPDTGTDYFYGGWYCRIEAATAENLGAELRSSCWEIQGTRLCGRVLVFSPYSGLPHVPFLMIAAITGTGAYFVNQSIRKREEGPC